jgi:hypothetical protein
LASRPGGNGRLAEGTVAVTKEAMSKALTGYIGA